MAERQTTSTCNPVFEFGAHKSGGAFDFTLKENVVPVVVRRSTPVPTSKRLRAASFGFPVSETPPSKKSASSPSRTARKMDFSTPKPLPPAVLSPQNYCTPKGQKIISEGFVASCGGAISVSQPSFGSSPSVLSPNSSSSRPHPSARRSPQALAAPLSTASSPRELAEGSSSGSTSSSSSSSASSASTSSGCEVIEKPEARAAGSSPSPRAGARALPHSSSSAAAEDISGDPFTFSPPQARAPGWETPRARSCASRGGSATAPFEGDPAMGTPSPSSSKRSRRSSHDLDEGQDWERRSLDEARQKRQYFDEVDRTPL
eukprot:RCo019411